MNRNDAVDCWAIFIIGCVVAYIFMCFIGERTRHFDRMPENAWRIYLESKIDERAGVEKARLK